MQVSSILDTHNVGPYHYYTEVLREILNYGETTSATPVVWFSTARRVSISVGYAAFGSPTSLIADRIRHLEESRVAGMSESPGDVPPWPWGSDQRPSRRIDPLEAVRVCPLLRNSLP